MAQFRSGNMSAFGEENQQNNHNMTYQYEGSGNLMGGGGAPYQPVNPYQQPNNSMMMNNSGYQQQALFAGNIEQDSMYAPGYQN